MTYVKRMRSFFNMQASSPVRRNRRGSAYLIVLGTALLVSTLAYAAILATRAKGRLAGEFADAAQARQNAWTGVELTRLWISKDANWRTNRTVGVWASNLALGTSAGTVTIEVGDPADNLLANFPHDSIVVKATGKKGKARHIMQVTIKANPTPLPALQCAVHTGGQIHIEGSKTFNAGGAIVSTNGNVRNDGTIQGSVQCTLALPAGTITNGLQILAPAKALPDSTIAEKYAAVGTQISTNTLDKRVLSPSLNPFGAANPYGIYVIRSTNDVTLKLTRIYGTLVVICPGRRLTIDNNVLLEPYRSDCPALVVVGDAHIQFASGNNSFREIDAGISLNPPGAPYNGVANTNISETFPSEIRGLVHVTGAILYRASATVRGAILSNSTAGADAFDVDDTTTITYTPGLYTSPPCWYTTAVPMVIDRGTWKPLAD